MLTNYTILCDSNIPWDHNRYSKHHIMSRLARQNNVLFVNPRVDVADYFGSKKLKFRQLLKRKTRPKGECLSVYTPLAPPFRDRFDIACTIDSFLFTWQIGRLLKNTDRSRLILFLGNAWNVNLMDKNPGCACSVYHCSDGFFCLFTGEFARRIAERETVMIQRSDVVVATSRPLYEKCLKLNDNTVLIGHGVDENFFKNWAGKDCPTDLSRIGGPRIGYVGSIDWRIDFDLIDFVVETLAQYSFVFIGKVESGCEERLNRLRQNSNFRYLGHKPWQELPAYISNLDVCMLPRVMSDFEKNVDCPLKLVEYLAAGKQVVASTLLVDEKFASSVFLSQDRDAFVENTRHAVETSGRPGLSNRISSLVANCGWDSKVKEYSAAIERAIESRISMGRK